MYLFKSNQSVPPKIIYSNPELHLFDLSQVKSAFGLCPALVLESDPKDGLFGPMKNTCLRISAVEHSCSRFAPFPVAIQSAEV